MKDLILYGAGGHSYAVMELINSLANYKPVIVYDDAPSSEEILGVPVAKFSGQAMDIDSMCISIGDNESRKKVSEKFDLNYPSFVHPSASVYPSASIGKGTVVFPNSVIDAAVQLGDFCIVNNNATLSHHVGVADFCHIAINAAIAGGVSIGEGALIGAGSIILQNIKIGKWAVIGAGAIVTKDVPDYAVVVGQPASVINYQKP